MKNFKDKVDSVISFFLFSNGFLFEKHLELSAGDKSLVFYRSEQARLCIYRSKREGEVNCKLAPLTASDNIDSNDWVYLNSILQEGREASLEELLNNVPDSPKSDEVQLTEILQKLESSSKVFATF